MTRIENKREKEGQIRTFGLRSLIMDDVALDLSTPFNYYSINQSLPDTFVIVHELIHKHHIDQHATSPWNNNYYRKKILVVPLSRC